MITNRAINPSQLAYEMGGVALRVVGPEEDGTWKVKADVDDATLAAAVEAHVADLDWVHPTPQPHQPLDPNGVAATLNAVLGVWSLTDAANAVQLPEQELIDEATAWAELAAAAVE
jgi:hypothetical protein